MTSAKPATENTALNSAVGDTAAAAADSNNNSNNQKMKLAEKYEKDERTRLWQLVFGVWVSFANSASYMERRAT